MELSDFVEQRYDVALRCIRFMRVKERVILDFEMNRNVYLFDTNVITRIEPDTELWNRIRDIELKFGVTVYAVTHDIMFYGKCYSFLCVSPYSVDWKLMVRSADETTFNVYAFVCSVDGELWSEFGSVLLKCVDGWLRRVG